jgi:hypothetical protein
VLARLRQVRVDGGNKNRREAQLSGGKSSNWNNCALANAKRHHSGKPKRILRRQRHESPRDRLPAAYGLTLAMPISVSSVRLSSICQLSVMRPFVILTRSVAMKAIA